MAPKNTLDLTRGPIAKRLFSFALPIFFMLLLQHLYNAADKAVVGQFAENGKDALAAIGATSSINAVLLNMKTGLASGANVHCANLRGAKDEEGLKKGMHTAILLSAVLGMFLALLGILISRPMLVALGTPEKILDDAVLYMRLYFAGAPAMSLYNFCTAIMRSNGDTKRPLYILIVSGIVNVSLNLVFVIVFKMRVAGVALATMAAQTLSAARLLKILFDPKDAYRLSFKELRITKRSMKEIFRIGIPAAVNGMLLNVSNVTVQSSVNSFNDTAIIAGKTAATDIANMLYQVLHAFALSCVSFAGQCYGAKKYKRIDELAGTTLLCGGGMLTLVALLATLFPEFVIGIFNNDPAVLEAGKSIMLINVWGYLLNAVADVFLNCSKGMGRSVGTTVMNVAGNILPRVIWVWFFFPMHHTIVWLYLCYPISWAISSIAQVTYYIRIRKQLDKQLLQDAAFQQ